MAPRFLPLTQTTNWLSQLLKEHAVFFPVVIDGKVHWQRLALEDDADGAGGPGGGLSCIRASEPVKAFFFSPREKVASLPEKFEPAMAEKRVLFGAKQCDIAALRVHRRIFLDGEFKDEFYASRRRNTLLVVADCPQPEDTCFCNLVGGQPHAGPEDRDEADVSLAVIEGGWIIEALSAAGEELVSQSGAAEASGAQVAVRDEQRRRASALLAGFNPREFAKDAPERIWKRNTDKVFWQHQAEGCVECYGCLAVCPTCYCFLLYDRPGEKAGMERTRVWDACYIAAYARVGGGANPRSEFHKRFFNRFYCKFSHFKTWQGMYACSGCGRCIRACMGKIDVRKAVLEA